MERQHRPAVSENYLLLSDEGEGQPTSILIESEAWYHWLATENNQSFTFRHALGTFTVRRERKRRSWYWYAYHKRNGKLHKAYVGKSEEMTLQRLNVVATGLAGLNNDHEASVADPFATSTSFPQEKRSTADQVAQEELSTHRRNLSTPTTTLPVYLTPLLGREQEVQEVCSLLQRPEVRLLTLTGPGGIGKTRLGVQVAAHLAQYFSDGVYFVPLAAVSSPDLVVPTIAQVLGLREGGDWSLSERLQAYLRPRHLLLLVDNFEQVLPAVSSLVELLTSCPHLKILVTSRAVLRMRGEQEFSLTPLALPDLKHLPAHETLLQYAAIELFMQRVWAFKPNFPFTSANARPIAEICVKVNGLPLALELAAARIKLFSPQALLARLEDQLRLLTYGASDALERQQTLRNTIKWSYELLSSAEQYLFRCLSVFMGGFTVEAVEHLYTALGASSLHVLDNLTSLLDKSLVQSLEQRQDEPRFFMLEAIREYGLECLAMHGEMEATRQAHSAYYLRLAEEAEPHLQGGQQAVWLERLEREHNNLRAALQWSLEKGEDGYGREKTLRLSAALWWFWLTRGHRHEGWALLERALAGSEGVAEPARVKALWAAGNLASWLGHSTQAEALCQQSLALAQWIGDTAGMRNALFHLGFLAHTRSDFAAARPLFERSLLLSRETGDMSLLGRTLILLAFEALFQGEYARVGFLMEEVLAAFKEFGSKRGMIFSLQTSAYMMFFQGNLERARALGEECIMVQREYGGKHFEAGMLAFLGNVTLHQGDILTTRLLLEQSCVLLREVIDEEYQMAWTSSLFGKLHAVQGDYATARACYEKSLQKLVHVQAANNNMAFLDLATVLEGLAAVVVAQGELEWAARLWGVAEALREARGIPLPPVYRADYECSVAAARSQLGMQAFAAAWAQGRTMTAEQALTAYRPTTKAVSATPPQSPVPYPNELSHRELEVLRLVAQGLTDAQVAERLVLSHRTVGWYLSSIYRKLGVSSRSAATLYAVKHHLV